VGEGAGDPEIGLNDYDPPADDKDRPRSGKADDRRAEAEPAPGFSLK
jgi:hypothetical protein